MAEEDGAAPPAPLDLEPRDSEDVAATARMLLRKIEGYGNDTHRGNKNKNMERLWPALTRYGFSETQPPKYGNYFIVPPPNFPKTSKKIKCLTGQKAFSLVKYLESVLSPKPVEILSPLPPPTPATTRGVCLGSYAEDANFTYSSDSRILHVHHPPKISSPYSSFYVACVRQGLATNCYSRSCRSSLALHSCRSSLALQQERFLDDQNQKFLDLMCRVESGSTPVHVENLTRNILHEFRACRGAATAAKILDLNTLDLMNRQKATILDVCAVSPTETHLLMLSIAVLSEVRIEERDMRNLETYVEVVLNEAEHRGHLVSSALQGIERPSFLQSSSERSILETLPLRLLDACLRSVFESRTSQYTRHCHFALAVRKVLMTRRLVAVRNAFPTHPAPSSKVLGYLAACVSHRGMYFTSCPACGRVYRDSQ